MRTTNPTADASAAREEIASPPDAGQRVPRSTGSSAAAWERIGCAGLIATVLLGVVLRWALAGLGMWTGEFQHVRSAHSHLGYYGVLFPFVWARWSAAGHWVPSPRWGIVYVIATAAATVDFAIHGYAFVSIVGSTLVLGFWITSAVQRLRRMASAGWSAVAPFAILASSLVIPAVAVLSARHDPAAVLWVQAFLTWLLLGVGAASVLDSIDAPPPPVWLHTIAVLGTGFAMGPFPQWPLRPFVALEAFLLLQAAWRGRRPDSTDLRICWAVAGLGFAMLATGTVAWNAILAVASLHFLLLGPILAVLAEARFPRIIRTAYLITVGAFAASVALTSLSASPLWPHAAAWIGSAIAAFWILTSLPKPNRKV